MKPLRYCIVIVALVYGALIVYAYAPIPTVAPETLAGPHSHFIPVDGKNIHYTVQGSGPAIVLVHGFGGSTIVWDRLSEYLEPHYSLYALDLPGFGLSDKPVDACYALSSQADIVGAYIRAIGLEQIFLIGHSMGGVIVADVAAQLPDTVMKLVMIEPGFYQGGPPAFLQHLFFPFERAMARLFYTRTGREKSLQASYYDTSRVTPELVDGMLTARRTPGAIAAMEAMTRAHNYEHYGHIAKALKTPSLILWGERGEATPRADIERISRDVSQSQVLFIEQCGHYVQDEQPVRTAQAVLEFFQSHAVNAP